jgi:hypothetical protein
VVAEHRGFEAQRHSVSMAYTIIQRPVKLHHFRQHSAVASSAETVYTRFAGMTGIGIGTALQPAATSFRLYSSLIYIYLNTL